MTCGRARCAWCQKDQGPRSWLQEGQVTHGCCEACLLSGKPFSDPGYVVRTRRVDGLAGVVVSVAFSEERAAAVRDISSPVESPARIRRISPGALGAWILRGRTQLETVPS